MRYLNLFLPEETLLDTTILLLSKFLWKQDFHVGEIFVFRFHYC